jgi:CHAT domain-containing protein/Tfp pilus assembly protein PilF
MFGLWPWFPLRAVAQPAGELTREQQGQLQRRVDELVKQAEQLEEQAKYPEATQLWQQILGIYQQLYPHSQYPHGHSDLADGLNIMGLLLQAQGDEPGARDFLQRALAMNQALYPNDRYPHGHREVATSMNNLGSLLREQGDFTGARRYQQQALAMRQALYPKDRYPHGHAQLASSLNNLGRLLQSQGDYVGARDYLQRALTMCQTLYPKDQYPHGHLHTAGGLFNLGGLFQEQRDYVVARGYYEQALNCFQALYPKDRYPDGHPHLAMSLNQMGVILQAQGNYPSARRYFEQALAMNQALYPKERYPCGHPKLAESLNNLGTLFWNQRDDAIARRYFEQALALDLVLYPKDRYPRGHLNLATDLNNVGRLLWDQGDCKGARDYFQQALAMDQARYPKDQYPHGSPYFATTLSNLGDLLWGLGDFAGARNTCQQELDMYQGLAEVLMPALSEAEALNHLASLPLARDALLSVSLHLPDSDAASYAEVWRSKGALFRILRSRQQALQHLTDPESREIWKQLAQSRRALARLILSPPRDPAIHRQRLQELTELKEKRERQLAERSAPFRRQQESAHATPTDLVQQLPPRSVFIDLLRYLRRERDLKIPGRKGETRTLSYVAFVLRPDQLPVRVELGAAAPIDAAVAAWRRDLARRPDSAAASTLRRLVWDPLARHLPADTRTVVLAPDGALTQLPWPALPGDRPSSVLLEDYAFGVVPNGPFLLDRLTATPEPEPNPGLLLAVGGVQYDQQTRPLGELPSEHLVAWRPAERGSRALWSAEHAAGVVAAAGAGPFQVVPFLLLAWPSWGYLPGTVREIEAVSQLADPRLVQLRQGTEANSAQLLQDLPHARYALLATHGFFADPEFRSVFLLDEAAFRHHEPEGRATPGARNPLVLSGLVLAGANQPPAADAEGMLTGDGSILTAEMIASLPLEHLELVVLSACETGLGQVAGGEGVYGLQRAFHMAGAQTTVASLWQVDDEITQELLTRFFENLWHKGLGRLGALRQAQLAVRRGEGNRAQPRYWAAWVLSGDPGNLDSTASAVPDERPAAVMAVPWWSSWPWYAAGVGAFAVLVVALVALQHRRAAR